MRRRIAHPWPISRRGLIQAAVGVAGTTALGCGGRGCGSRAPLEKRQADVVVVGAGLSGLVTARELSKAGFDSVLVLEARDRVGGLTVSQPIADGVMVDGGGEWAGPAHTRLLALAKELRVETTSAEEDKKLNPVFHFDGVRTAGTNRLFSREEARELRELRDKLEAMAEELPPGAPWEAKRAVEYDKLSMFNWLRDNSRTVWGRRDIELAIDFTFGAQPEDISLLHFVATIKACGGLEKLMAISESQDVSFVGGAQRLSLRMAEELGDRVILASPVKRIVDRLSEPVRVETDRLSIETGLVVVAMMPADNRRIKFEPELPELRRGLVRSWSGSPDYKAHIVYATPFWRRAGLSGTAVGDGNVVDFIFDSTPPGESRGVLVAFGSGDVLPSDVRERQEVVTRTLVEFFDEEARTPVGFIEMDWYGEAWSSGCASPLKPGVLTRYGRALREPVGRIHWAGSDVSPVWNGFMEGAVRSGEQAAAEVIAALKESRAAAAPATSG